MKNSTLVKKLDEAREIYTRAYNERDSKKTETLALLAKLIRALETECARRGIFA